MTTLYDEKWGQGPRTCGGCTLCCRLLPVHHDGDMPGGWHKAAGERCRHQRTGKGCAVYRKAGFPTACVYWNCRWLTGIDTAELRRPDRAHYVLDVVPDYVTLSADDLTPTKIEVVQVWCDPKYPDAHKDPALRAYLARRGEEGVAALIRYSSGDAFFLCPPAMSSDGQWHERHDGQVEPDRTPEEMVAGVAEARGQT